MVVGVDDVSNHINFGFNIFRGFRPTVGPNLLFPLTAGDHYNSADAAAQPMMTS